MRKAIILTTALWPISAFGQSQASLNATAQMIMSSQQQQVPGGECYTLANGPCNNGLVPITFQSGDVVLQGSITDAQGNVWSLAPDSCNGNPPGSWWSGLYENGQQISCGYGVALRNVNGVVWYEEAKGSGWRPATQNNGLAGPYVTNPGQGTSSGQSATNTPVTGAASFSSASANATSASTSAQSCPGQTTLVGILPGVGSFTDSSGNTYAIDPNGNTATINGQPITPNGESSNTSQMVDLGGVVYGEDATTNQWFELVPGPGGDRPYAWQPVASLPQAGQSPTVTTRWNTVQAAETSFTCQGLQASQGAVTPVTSLPAAQAPAASVTPVTSLGPALAFSLGGVTVSISGITPANTIGGTQ